MKKEPADFIQCAFDEGKRVESLEICTRRGNSNSTEDIYE